MQLKGKMAFSFGNDLNSYQGYPPSSEVAHEPRTHDIFANHGIHPPQRVCSHRGKISRREVCEVIFLHGSIPLHGICTIGLPRKPARHRMLYAYSSLQALAHGLARSHLPQHFSPRQRTPQLADVGRLCPSLDPRGSSTLRQRSIRGGTQRSGLRFRFHHHKPLPLAFSVSVIPQGIGSASRRESKIYEPRRKSDDFTINSLCLPRTTSTSHKMCYPVPSSN